jgi:hypothetical protein
MRAALLTPLRLLSGIAAFTVLCMFAVSAVTDHLADVFLTGRQQLVPTSRVHLIDDVSRALKRAETARLEYIATKSNSYIAAYKQASNDVDASMGLLVAKDANVTTTLNDAADLRVFVRGKLASIGDAMLNDYTPPAGVPDAETELSRVEKIMESLARSESQDVSAELEAARARSEFHRKLTIAIGAINVLFLLGIAFCATQIGKLYSLITMCAWSKRVQYKDQWVPLEEYMRKRFGIRISHGISEEEYKKWGISENRDAEPADAPAAPIEVAARNDKPKAAA